MPAFQPYWGKPAVRNDRGDGGNVGIIRSPLRATVLPDCGGRSAMVVPTTTVIAQLLINVSSRYFHPSEHAALDAISALGGHKIGHSQNKPAQLPLQKM